MSLGNAEGDAALRRVPFPKYTVGLLQSESEMIQVPGYDLLPSLEKDDRWDVELYTERTVGALVDSAERFDCIVVGYNAAIRSSEVQAALRETEIPIGLLVLHQFDPNAFHILDEPLVTETLSAVSHLAHVPPASESHEEILLNWPKRVRLPHGVLKHSTAQVGLTPPPDSRWETVLEINDGHRRVPVLVRTQPERWPPRAVSAVLLAPRYPQHCKLLGNLIAWCAAGRPSAVVVEAPSGPSAAIIHRKLRLQGVKAVVEPVSDQTKLDLHAWPFWGTRDVVLPHSWDPTREAGWPKDDPHHAKPWLRRGHRIILLGPGDSLTIRHGESDAHWVARRWASWFQGVPSVTWHGRTREHPGSIVATRSILRMLALLSGTGRGTSLPGLDTALDVVETLAAGGTGIDPKALGLPNPLSFAQPVKQLLSERLRDLDNVDDTVSATVAALDIDALLEGRALGARATELEGWLRRELPHRALEDRLEIARYLGERELLTEVISTAGKDTRAEEPVSAVLVTTLRSALVACDASPEVSESLVPFKSEEAVVYTELRVRPMLAAVYLLGVLDLQRLWPEELEEPARRLRDPPAERIDRAIVTLGRHGPLSRGHTGWEPPVPELASTEALALIAYFARYPVPTHVVQEGDVVSPQVLGSLLQEAESVRRVNEDLDQNLARKEAAATRGGRELSLLGGAMIIAFVVVFALLLPDIDATWEIPSAFFLWTLLMLGFLALLRRYELPVKWAAQIAPLLAGGWSAVRDKLARAVTSTPTERSEVKDQKDTPGPG